MATIHHFPKDDIDPRDKDRRWGLQVAQAIWSMRENGNTIINDADVLDIRMLRAYSSGRQNINQYWGKLYQDPTIKKGDVDAQRKGLVNISDRIVSIAPKLKAIAMGSMEEIDHNTYAESVDPTSKKKKLEAKYDNWIKSLMMPLAKTLEERNGIPAPRLKFQTNTIQELEVYEMVGGFRLGHEIALESLAKSIQKDSQWHKIVRKLREDIWDLHKTCLRHTFNVETGRINLEYVDLEKAVIGYGGDGPNSKVPFAGHIYETTIGQLMPRLEQNGITEDAIKKIALSALNNAPNHKGNREYWLRTDPKTNMPRYYNLSVELFHFEYITNDKKYKTKREKEDGTKVYQNEKFGKVKNNEKKETVIIDTQMLYEGDWIINSEVVLDWGKATYMLRPSKDRVRCSYEYVEISGDSPVKRILEFLDSLQLTWMKLNIAKAVAAPKGIAIQVDGLMDVDFGWGVLKPFELVKMYKQTGSFAYRLTNQFGRHTGNPNGPLRELEGGIGNQLNEMLTLWATDINNCFEFSGLNEVSAKAVSPDEGPNRSVASSQIAMQQTDNALKPLYEAITTLKEDGIQSAVKRCISLIAYNKQSRSTYSDIIGENSVQALMSVKDVNLEDLGIRMIAVPNNAARQDIMDAAKEALKIGKNGQASITHSDYIMITNLLDKGLLKQAWVYLEYRKEENDKKQREIASQNVKQQAEEERNTAMFKSELKKSEEQTKTQGQLAIVEAEGKKDVALETLRHQNKLEELKLEGEIEVQKGVEVSGAV